MEDSTTLACRPYSCHDILQVTDLETFRTRVAEHCAPLNVPVTFFYYHIINIIQECYVVIKFCQNEEHFFPVSTNNLQ